MMTEYEKAQAGYLYDANYDESLALKRAECAEKCFDFNNARYTIRYFNLPYCYYRYFSNF